MMISPMPAEKMLLDLGSQLAPLGGIVALYVIVVMAAIVVLSLRELREPRRSTPVLDLTRARRGAQGIAVGLDEAA